MTEEEYFDIINQEKDNKTNNKASSKTNSKASSKTTNKATNKTNSKSTNKENNIIIQEKPIYNYTRNSQGKINIDTINEKEIPTIEKENENIINNALDNIQQVMDKMLSDYNFELTKTQVEIEININLYKIYGKEIYNKQITALQSKKLELVNKIRILNGIAEDFK